MLESLPEKYYFYMNHHVNGTNYSTDEILELKIFDLVTCHDVMAYLHLFLLNLKSLVHDGHFINLKYFMDHKHVLSFT